MKSLSVVLFALLSAIAAGVDENIGIPAQTSYAALLIELAKRYNPSTCGTYTSTLSSDTVDYLVTVVTNIGCDGQTFAVVGTGNGLDVKFPLVDSNYTAVDLKTLMSCGMTGGCFNTSYVGSSPPTAVACTAYAKRSTEAPTENCTSCSVCQGVFSLEMTIDCDNVDSSYTTTSDCAAPFSYNSSVMGVTLPSGGGGGGGTSAGSRWIGDAPYINGILGTLAGVLMLWL